LKALATTHPADADTLGRLARLGTVDSRCSAADRVEAWLSSEPAIARGARGLAIFSSQGGHLLEAVPLPKPVEPLAIVDTIPWLEPLAETISPGAWGVAIVSRRGARLLRGGPAGLTEFATITDRLHRRHAEDGGAQARFQRGVDDRLLRAHRRSPFDHLVVACACELRAMIAHSLDGELKGVLVGIVDRDLEHASVEQITGVVAPLIERAERSANASSWPGSRRGSRPVA
jgi:Bacterial archaeo-eukaryotic release factor family 10